MDARKLYNNMLPFAGMKKSARMILGSDGKCTVDELAKMTDYEICEKILEDYVVISSKIDEIILVQKEDMHIYSAITKMLKR